MEISLRPATRDDYDFLWWLHRTTMQSYVEKTWGWDETGQALYFQQHFDPSKWEIIEADVSAIGYLSVQRCEDPIFLETIEIAPDYQSQGIGTKLIRA